MCYLFIILCFCVIWVCMWCILRKYGTLWCSGRATSTIALSLFGRICVVEMRRCEAAKAMEPYNYHTFAVFLQLFDYIQRVSVDCWSVGNCQSNPYRSYRRRRGFFRIQSMTNLTSNIRGSGAVFKRSWLTMKLLCSSQHSHR